MLGCYIIRPSGDTLYLGRLAVRAVWSMRSAVLAGIFPSQRHSVLMSLLFHKISSKSAGVIFFICRLFVVFKSFDIWCAPCSA